MEIYSDATKVSQQESDSKNVEDDIKKSVAAENFKILDTLLRSKEWQWYEENILRKAVSEQQLIALNPNQPRDERDKAVYRHSFGVELLENLFQQRIMWAAQAGIKLFSTTSTKG